jgi:NAD-reducing hydrogenase large subunit
MATDPDLARGGIRLRQFGQKVIELLGAQKIHPAWAVPGGVRSPLSDEGRNWIKERLPESFATINNALDLFKQLLDRFDREVQTFGNFPSLFMSLVGADGRWEHYGGHIRIKDADGNIVADRLSEDDYQTFIGEAVESWSFLKFPYYKPLGYPDGMYRVGPLARVNICDHFGTEMPIANSANSAIALAVLLILHFSITMPGWWKFSLPWNGWHNWSKIQISAQPIPVLQLVLINSKALA